MNYSVDGADDEVTSEEIAIFGLSRMNNFNRSSSSCPHDLLPSIPAYLSATNVYGITLVVLGTVAILLVLIMFIDTLRYIMKHSSSRVKAHSAFVLGVYPVVALATYLAILVPRAHLLAEAITQGIFMAAMYQLFCLFVAYCGGEAELIRKVKPETLNMKVGPCCCWPCCCCLPQVNMTKGVVRRLRLLVLQLPVVQGLVYLTLLVMWAERESLYQVNYMYLQPLIIMSILFGVWAMAMTINLLKIVLKDYLMLGKFVVLQLVLILAKLQGLGVRIVLWADLLPCKPPITPMVYANLLYNSLMLIEMVLLGFIARKLYKKILPEAELPTHISTIGGILGSETNYNSISNNNSTNWVDNNKTTKNIMPVGFTNAALDVKE